ncbi:hypothetical protein [Martelella mediterranea]|uniref:N-acetyltransferase domain-containing protein n=1 Tax=Martelella mediterranea DSM 17316 TaxID=1122214 RepID=A0A1U9Z868_9HYPH|nr:hypothetical protein [Martelella mediterranea]AQZ53820.1 hypothetical protein Mame_04528 [Martelella mediterranea DSM 17316]
MVVGVPLRSAPERREAARAGLRFSLLGPGADIRPVVALAREAHAESRFSYIPFSPAKVEAIIARIVARPAQSACILATRGGDVVGMLWCSVGEYHIGSDVLLTTIHNLNVAKPLRATLAGGRVTLGLLKRAEAWSRAKGAREMLFHVTSGVETERTERMMRKLGYEGIGGNYVRFRFSSF